jgi:hypothetical protein
MLSVRMHMLLTGCDHTVSYGVVVGSNTVPTGPFPYARGGLRRRSRVSTQEGVVTMGDRPGRLLASGGVTVPLACGRVLYRLSAFLFFS